jgi:hypothetical protein
MFCALNRARDCSTTIHQLCNILGVLCVSAVIPESDRAMWTKFSGNAELVAAEAEDAFARLDPDQAAQEQAHIRVPEGETDVLRLIRARRVQSFFRAAVMTSYDFRCPISGTALPELLVASHISRGRILWNAAPILETACASTRSSIAHSTGG